MKAYTVHQLAEPVQPVTVTGYCAIRKPELPNQDEIGNHPEIDDLRAVFSLP